MRYEPVCVKRHLLSQLALSLMHFTPDIEAHPVLPDLVTEPLLEFEVLPTCSQAGEVDDKCEGHGVEQHGEGLEVLCHVKDARQATHDPYGMCWHDFDTSLISKTGLKVFDNHKV